MKLGITADLYNPGHIVTSQFLAFTEECPFMWDIAQWYSTTTRDEAIENLAGIGYVIGGSAHTDLLKIGNGYVMLYASQGGNGYSATMIAPTRDEARHIAARVYAAIPVADIPEGNLRLKFWSLTMNGPRSYTRQIEVPEWPEIRENYPRAVRSDLERLMVDYVPNKSGLLLLWHGEPGTGKTTALRALMQSWRPWCSAEYIVDPEKFFGEAPSYLVDVLLGQDDDIPTKADGTRSEVPWRLLILEDTGHLITQDADSRSGQGLSRLLNVADGLIGQGLKIQVLITTNEAIDRLHPAVSRPGRAAAQVSFTAFERDEAREWLDLHERFEATGGGKTLAELYAIANGYEDRAKRAKPVGFQP